ncbi:MAG: hypothetical protein HY721_26430 [Planctomycetes bacterium]|nr:hypothetical protein [Planctomycetota bacterium]
MRYRASGALLACVSLLTAALHGENRFFVLDAALPAGASGEEIPLRADNDEPVLGFAIAVRLDPAQLAATAISAAGTLAEGADYFAGRMDPAAGALAYGCVFAFQPRPGGVMPPGTDRVLAKVVVDVGGAAGTVTEVVFGDVQIDPSPPVKNSLTKETGHTLVPSLSAGTIAIEDRTPRIEEVTPGEGRAGDAFRVAGRFFGEPGLAVRVCGAPAEAALEPDGRTLVVTAPECGSVGFAEVEVCTVRGCDARPEGFRYLPPPETPFVRGNTNTDASVDLSDGIRVLLYLFLGGEPSRCQDSMDANDDGGVDLSDASYLFNFLFLGGPEIPPPYPAPGTDPTPDELPGC